MPLLLLYKSEHAFIVTVTKLVFGMNNTKLCKMFGEHSDESICRIYHYTIRILDSKLESYIHDSKCMEHCVDYFQEYAGYIKRKLVHEAYGGMLFDSFCIIRFIPMAEL
jgi:hypothetical protein